MKTIDVHPVGDSISVVVVACRKHMEQGNLNIPLPVCRVLFQYKVLSCTQDKQFYIDLFPSKESLVRDYVST